MIDTPWGRKHETELIPPGYNGRIFSLARCDPRKYTAFGGSTIGWPMTSCRLIRAPLMFPMSSPYEVASLTYTCYNFWALMAVPVLFIYIYLNIASHNVVHNLVVQQGTDVMKNLQ